MEICCKAKLHTSWSLARISVLTLGVTTLPRLNPVPVTIWRTLRLFATKSITYFGLNRLLSVSRVCCIMAMVASAIWALKSLLWLLPRYKYCMASLNNTSIPRRILYISIICLKVNPVLVVTMTRKFFCRAYLTKNNFSMYPLLSTTYSMYRAFSAPDLLT